MFGFRKNEKSEQRSRIMPKALLLLAMIPAALAAATVVSVAAAPAASAEEINVTNDAKDGTRYNSAGSPTKPPASKPGGSVSEQVDPTLVSTDYYPFEAWFYEPGKIGQPPFPPLRQVSFDILASTNCTAHPAADRSYPYNGNAIPIPNSVGEGGTTRLVWVSHTWIVENHKETYSYTETYPTTVFDPATGMSTTVYDKVTFPNQEKTWQEVTARVSCKYQTSPTWTPNRCVTYGETNIDGPYDQSWNPMLTVQGGGTNTRVPDKTTGEIGVLGMVRKEWSNQFGKRMQAEGQNATSSTPSLPNVWANCVPNSGNSFDASINDDIASLGRYDATIKQWWVTVYFQRFSTQNWTNVYKGIAGAAGGDTSLIRNLSGTGYYIRNVSAPVLQTTHDYFKMICKSGSDPSGTVSLKYVAQGTTAGRNAVNWDDSAPNYYTWNCGDTPGTSDNTGDTGDDFLQCQNYASPNGTVKVGNKVAAPLQSVTQVIDGQVVTVNPTGDTYVIPATGDPIHATWQQIRINTRSGQNINDVGQNVVWDYNYRLAPWSSPMLKNKDVNDLSQPYHGWEDKTADSVLAAEIPLGTKWEPDKFYEYKTLAYTYTTKPYTYHTEYSYLPYSYYQETRQTGTETYACGSYSYQCGSYQYQCGTGSYNRVDSGGATWYWWVNGGRGGYACPGGWWLSGSTCYTNTTVYYPIYCTGYNYCTGTNYCTRPTYGTFTVKSPPPSGYFDNGTQYQKNTTVKDAPPAGYFDDGTQYKMLNPPPYGYTDMGNGVYTSVDLLNTSGKTGGIAFDKWRKWPSSTGLNACTINLSKYTSKATGSYTLECGDNVTDSMRGAYFRFFMSSTAGSQGWQVTPWARVTADVQASFRQASGFTMNPDGTLSMNWTDVSNQWVRQSYECPAQPLKVDVKRIVN